jgi:Caspase domain
VRNDTEALARILRKDGFSVDLVENATHADIMRAIQHLQATVRAHSIVFFYFGG